MTKHKTILFVAVVGLAIALYGLLYDHGWWLPVLLLTLVIVIGWQRQSAK